MIRGLRNAESGNVAWPNGLAWVADQLSHDFADLPSPIPVRAPLVFARRRVITRNPLVCGFRAG